MGLSDEKTNITQCVMTRLLSVKKMDITPSNPLFSQSDENGCKPEVCFPTGPSLPTVH